MSTDIAEMSEGPAATAEAPAKTVEPSAPAEVIDGTYCSNCSETTDWDGCSWCPACGFYPAMNKCVEVEKPQYAVADGPTNLLEAIPAWAWVMLGGVVAIVAGSIVVRLQVAGNAPLRAAWSFSQIALAEFATMVVHVLALVYASSKSDRYSPFDLILKPLALWKPTFNALPWNAWRVWVFAWGQTAMICAVAIIGGLNYSALFDWGVEKHEKPNLVKAVADQARNKDGSESPTEALSEAAGEEGGGGGSLEDSLKDADGAADDAGPAEEDAAAALPKAECLIFGFRRAKPSAANAEVVGNLQAATQSTGQADPLTEGEISSVLLATSVNNRLRYVGMIAATSLPPETLEALKAQLPDLVSSKPFVKCRLPAVWLKPKLMCEVEYEEWGYAYQMKKAKFLRMLDDVDGN